MLQHLIILIATWDPALNADYYEVEYYRCFSEYGYYATITEQQYHTLPVSRQTVYALRVRACNAADCGLWEYSERYRLDEDELDTEDTRCVFLSTEDD